MVFNIQLKGTEKKKIQVTVEQKKKNVDSFSDF